MALPFQPDFSFAASARSTMSTPTSVGVAFWIERPSGGSLKLQSSVLTIGPWGPMKCSSAVPPEGSLTSFKPRSRNGIAPARGQRCPPATPARARADGRNRPASCRRLERPGGGLRRPRSSRRPSMPSAVGPCKGCKGTVNVSRTFACPAGIFAPLRPKPAGASFSSRSIAPLKPSRRRACTVTGTAVPARALMLEGTTRRSKSGRGG